MQGKPYAGNPHVRFDEGDAASTATSRRGSLLYTKTDATKGKSYAENPYMRFDEGKCLVGGNARRGVLLNNGGILRKFHLLTIASLLTVLAAHAETWYLSKNSSTKDKGWSGDDAGGFWKDSANNPGSGSLNPKDTYWHKDGLLLRGRYNFEGGDLYIGDTNAPNYTTRLCMDAGVSNDGDKLVLAVGYAYKNGSSTSQYAIKSPIIESPKNKPFGFYLTADDNTMRITGTLEGENGVGFVIGGYYDGSDIVRKDATNVTLCMEADMSEYHGDIRVVSKKPLISPTKGNVTFTFPPTDSDATIEIEDGAKLKVASVGEVKLSGLTLHTESLVEIPYDSISKTTGVIRVTDQFLIPEDEGKVRIHFATKPSVPEDEWPYIYPILIVPSTQEMDAEKFALSDESVYVGDEKPLLSVFEDKENGVKSLVAIFPGRGKLTTSDSAQYSGSGQDFSVYGSAFTNAASWSNGNLPHEYAIYEFGYFGKNSGWGHMIRTPYDREGDYVFPGLALRAVRKAGEEADAIFVLADNTKTTVNLELTCPLSLRVVNSRDPTLAGTIRMDDDVVSCAWHGSVLTIDSVLSGTGNWTVSGITGTGKPHSQISFTADNSEWKGTISLRQGKGSASSGVPGLANDKHQKILVTNPAGLGGRLDEFNYKALSLADCSEVIVTNSLELANGLNRGMYISSTAGTVNVSANCDFVCNWPVTVNGVFRKTGNGTLSLGASAQLLEVIYTTNITENVDDSGNVTAVTNIVVEEQMLVDGIQKDPLKRQLSVQAGAVKALAHNCINGLTVDFKPNAVTSLVLEFNPADDDLKRYGFYNVRTDTPFAAGGEINIRIDNPDADALVAAKTYKIGLITVKTSAANALNLDSLIKFNKPEEFGNLKVRMIREDDAETGLTTYSAYYDFVGFQVIVR